MENQKNQKIMILFIIVLNIIVLGLIVFLLYPKFGSNDQANYCDDMDIILNTTKDLKPGCNPNLVSFSQAYEHEPQGVFVYQDSVWTNGDYMKQIDSYNSASDMLGAFFSPELLAQSLILFDEDSGRRAGFFVYLLRSLGRDDVSLLVGQDLKQNMTRTTNISAVNSVIHDITSDRYKEVFGAGYIPWDDIRLVLHTDDIRLSSGDVFLYTSDEAAMKTDDFYSSYTGQALITNLYWSKLFEFGGDILPNSQIQELLVSKDINLSKVKTLYIYYPQYPDRAGVVGLILHSMMR